MRTVKSCGPDASTPASSLREDAQTTVTRKPDRRGEHEVSRKPPCREGRIASAEPVCSCASSILHFARETAGAARTRLSLRPLLSEGQCSCFSSGASRREMADARLRVYIRLGHGGTLQASPTPGSRI